MGRQFCSDVTFVIREEVSLVASVTVERMAGGGETRWIRLTFVDNWVRETVSLDFSLRRSF